MSTNISFLLLFAEPTYNGLIEASYLIVFPAPKIFPNPPKLLKKKHLNLKIFINFFYYFEEEKKRTRFKQVLLQRQVHLQYKILLIQMKLVKANQNLSSHLKFHILAQNFF